MSNFSADVMAEIAPGITVYRKDGKWNWRSSRPNTTLQDVLSELDFQIHRLHVKQDFLQEALAGLQGTQTDPPKTTP